MPLLPVPGCLRHVSSLRGIVVLRLALLFLPTTRFQSRLVSRESLDPAVCSLDASFTHRRVLCREVVVLPQRLVIPKTASPPKSVEVTTAGAWAECGTY
jgi:hypothetical protein